jgi:hypothetical protein
MRNVAIAPMLQHRRRQKLRNEVAADWHTGKPSNPQANELVDGLRVGKGGLPPLGLSRVRLVRKSGGKPTFPTLSFSHFEFSVGVSVCDAFRFA